MNGASRDGVAIIGMAGRFPGAASIEELWSNLLAGRECITHFTPEQLSSLVPAELRTHPRYVPACGVIADADRFDAGFFGVSAREAQLIDPQQRVMLELSWNALEHAGVDPARFAGNVGVYAGTSNNGYRKLIDLRPDLLAASGEFAAMLANEKDYVATRIAHKLGLHGPAISLYTACSTSLVAVAQAWYALMSWQCDLALAGGINIVVPQESGYLPAEGAIESVDGHCRPFDAEASGTVFSSGAGVVVLKRLADAIADGDTIWAVIRGVGVNNDGADKASFGAPSARGQAAAIRLALASADLDADAIGYVEAHGTGTPLGDPIEIEGLTRAFASDQEDRTSANAQTCWLGSIKGNFGHLVAASGVAGLIKATLALHHGKIPPSINYRTPNPEIDFSHSPFRVADRVVEWPRGDVPRHAGVSSFGVGGTNAHVVLEEAPPSAPSTIARSAMFHVLPLSARDEQALRRRANELAAHLATCTDMDLPDIAATLALGRQPMPVRGAIVAETCGQARERLALITPVRAGTPKLAFLFPGQGSQHANMARELVATEPVFRAEFERGCALASAHLARDLRTLILPAPGDEAAADADLAETHVTQPALFVVEYALAKLWESWGIVPDAMIGHSIGEYVAATLAGVFAFEDAIAIVCARAAAMQAQPHGAMLAVRAASDTVVARLSGGIALAASNAPELCVVSGTDVAVDAFAAALHADGIASTRLRLSHAFHSSLMEGALAPFARAFNGVKLSRPTRPFHSCVTGAPISAEDATDPAYWCRQLRQAVRFADAVTHALADGTTLFVEVGPSQALTTFARMQLVGRGQAVASLGPAGRPGRDTEHLAGALATCWTVGREPDWTRYHAGRKARRVPLPTYPFGGQRFWIDVEPPRAAEKGEDRIMGNEVAGEATMAMNPARGDRLRGELRALVEHLTGENVDASRHAATFLELGFDSLSLTQAALELERRYGLKLKFRRLMEDVDTIDRLADLLDAHLPQDQAAAIAAPLLTTGTASVGAAAAASATPLLAELFRTQHELLQQQSKLLAALAGASPASALPTQTTTTSVPASTPAIQAEGSPASDAPAPANLIERPFGASARITVKRDQSMTPRQRAFVDDFTRRYNARTAKSKAFAQSNRALMADPRVVTGFHPLWKELVYPIVVERSKGASMTDLDGNAYIDCLNAFGANFLGYQPDFIADALKAQIDAGFEIGPQHPLTAEVAALIAEMTGMQRVAFCNTGSEAVMGAMRIARTVTGRKTIAIFTNSYHGIFDEVIVRGTRTLRSLAAAPGILASAVENVLVLDYGSDESLRILRERAHELAAIMIEPVQGKNPTLQPRDFIRALRPICDQGGCALIFDEVITGFRIAQGGAQEYFGVRADIATYGKIIGGGLPFAAIAGDAKWLGALDGGEWRFGDGSYPEQGVTYFAGTFVRHPLALAAAKAALTHLKRQGPALQEALNARARALVDRLNALFAASGAPLTAVGFSSLWRIVADEDQPFASLFWYALRANGLHVYEQFNCFLTTAHGEAEIEKIVGAVRQATDTLMGSGLLLARGDASEPANEAAADGLPETVPLTDGQLEKWLGCHYGAGAELVCNEAAVLHFDGAIDRDVFKRALALVWSRHEAFRFAIAADGRTQTLQAPTPLPLVELDMSGADAEARLDAYCDAQMRTPFDLSRAPLLRFALIQLGERRATLHVIAHHLVMDGWSLAVLIGEIEETYNALRSGRTPSLPPAESFRAYVLAEQQRRADNAAQVEYWRGVYADPPAPLELQRDRPRTQHEDFAANTERHVFAEDLTAKLRAEARRRSVTMYALLLAGFARFLARLSGQRDFAIGIPFAGQALAGSGALIGDGVNTLPLRLRARADEDFGSLVAKAHAALMDAAENQDLTMLNVMRVLGPRSRDALGRVIFNLNPRLRDPAFAGVATRWQDCRHAALLWDLFFNLNDNGRALALDLHFRTSLYDAQTIRSWIGEFERVLAAIVEPQERSATVVTEMPMSRDRATLLDLVDTQVRRTPDRIAIECGPEKLTYSELWSRSGALASTLIDRGIDRGEIVGVCLPRRPEMLVGLLGVLRAGAAYVPLDAGFPDQRLATMIEQAKLRRTVVFDGEDLPAAVLERGGEMIAVTRIAQTARAENLPSVRGDDLAYVLFTSGSTGTPKGVRVLHRNLASFLAAMLDEPGLAADDVLCAVTTLSFDIAGLELYLPLTIGARVLLATENEVHDPHALTRLIREGHAIALQTTPTLLRLLVEGAGANAVDGLKLLVGGEALPRDLAEAVLPHCSALWNMYGPTETTIWSALARVSTGQGAVPLGRPIAGTRIYVLDEQGRPVADGVHGEIWIGGEGVADGYLGRADLTRERFRSDPYAGSGASMYRTGDIGSMQQGVLHFHGRNDDQIKLRGFRVELGDVETAAAADPSVRETAAVLHSFGEHDARIVLYVTTRSADSEITTRLRHSLRDALPPYMRPQHIEVLAAMPKTPNGKIDRKALPSPFVPAVVIPPAPQSPGDSHSDYLAAIWREIIGVDDVRAADNFFELGGDSLLAVDMMARVERDTGVRLTVLAIATGTLESLSQTIGRGVASANRGWFARLRGAIGGARGR